MSACEAFLTTSKICCFFKPCCPSNKRKVRAKLLEKGTDRLEKSLDVVNLVKQMEQVKSFFKLILDKPARVMF